MPIILRSLAAAGLALALTAPRLPAQAPDVQSGVEIQARGPVHEAFAQLNLPEPQGPGEAAPKQPPSPVPELPPDQKPQGNSVEWLPGYWQWDAGANQFVWVTGVYRNAPPGRRWVQGYWAQTDQGWQWVHGFWAPAQQGEVTYQPQPPAPRDDGPAPPAPNDNAYYIPGTWLYQQNQYAWRPGFWSAGQPNWVYNPPQYYWTPGGYVFVDGYWDYPLGNRGLLFAPVAFSRPLWTTPGWYYRPSYVVGPAALLNALWVRPAWGSYYFGNYYGPAYARAGLQPWYAWGPRAYDPLFGYYRGQNRANPQWAANLRTVHQDRVAGRAPLPPNTLTQQLARSRTAPVVTPLSQAGRLPGANVQLTRVGNTQASQLRTTAQRTQNIGAERKRVETINRAGSTTLKLPANGHATVTRAGTTTYRPSYSPSAQARTNTAAAAARKTTVHTPSAGARTTAARTTHAPSYRPSVSAARYRAPAAHHAPSGGRGGHGRR